MRRFYNTIPVVCALAAAVFVAAPASAAEATYEVAVDAARPGATIPADFVGVSFETETVRRHLFLPSNAIGKSLLRLYHGLGPNGVLRIGGAAADSAEPRPNEAELKALAAFVKSLGNGWSLIWGLNCEHGTPEADAAEAKTLVESLGANRVIFQIGNESDMYHEHSFPAYRAKWEPIHAAVVAAAPGARFAGPDAAGTDPQFISQFVAALGSQTVMFTEHNYGAGSRTPSPELIVRALNNPKVVPYLREGIALARSARLPARLSETGSIAAVGPEVAATVGAASFDVWEMITLAENGWVGVNFHGGTSGGYSAQMLTDPASGTWNPVGTFYALSLFEHLAGDRIVPAKTNAPGSAATFATVNSAGETHVLLVNKAQAEPAHFTVTSTAPWANGSVLLMTAPNYASTDITLGGAKIGPDGTAASNATRLQKGAGNAASVTVPAGSTALVTLTR